VDNNDHNNADSAQAQSMSKAPNSVIVARALFLLNAAIWVLFGVVSLIRMSNSAAGSASMWIVAILMFANACVMLWVGGGLGKQQRRFYYLALVVLAVNIILTVTDQFGLFDLIILVFDAVLFALLVATRAGYSKGQP